MNFDKENISIQKICSFFDVPMSLLSNKDKEKLKSAGYDLNDIADDQSVNVNYIDANELLAPWQIANSENDYDLDCFHAEMDEIFNKHPYYLVFSIDDSGKCTESDMRLVDKAYKIFERDNAETEDWLIYSNGEYAVFSETATTEDGQKDHYTIGVVGVETYSSIPDDKKEFEKYLFQKVVQSLEGTVIC